MKKKSIKKIYILGQTGCGKTYLANKLSKKLKLPHKEKENS